METLTMSGIAQLAGVQRPVVSVWRARHRGGPIPFPAPTDPHSLVFDADEVAAWLTASGHGNNPEAAAERALHSSAIRPIMADPDHASALLLLHHFTGEAVTSLNSHDAVELTVANGLIPVLDASAATQALAHPTLAAAVDRVVEAAFSAERVLDQMVAGFTASEGAWRADSLSAHGSRLIGTILAELYRAWPSVIVPVDHGGLVLAGVLTEQLQERERSTFARLPSTSTTPEARAAWRRLSAFGCAVQGCEENGDGPTFPAGTLALMQQQDPNDSGAFFDSVDRAVLALGPTDVLVVVGPARLMTDATGGIGRRRLLIPSPGNEAPLRYVARLPKGLSRFGGRRRLALWVFSRTIADRGWTVAGSHSDVAIDNVTTAAIAADVAASVSNPDVHAHAFLNSAIRASDRFLQLRTLAIQPDQPQTVDGGAQHARVLELDTDLLDGVRLTASVAKTRTIVLRDAAPELGRDLSGTRLPAEHIGPPAAGAVTVVGPQEIRDPRTRGLRAIDRLTLEEVAPQARTTRRGDVVYVAQGGTAAYVDNEGGTVVQSPARIFRCRDAEDDGHQLVPEVIAADISRQARPDRDTWRLRLVPVEQVEAIKETSRRIEGRRTKLLDQLQALSALEDELLDGLSAGSLTAQIEEAADVAEEV